MSEFDKLKDDAEQYAKDHPEQVQKGEQAAEKKLGLPEQGGSNQPAQGNQPGQDAQGQAQSDQDSGQDSGGQGGQGSGAQGQ
jgi:hypothetical protein